MLLTLVLAAMVLQIEGREPPVTHNDDMTASEKLKFCTPWGKMRIAIKNKDGTFSHVDRIPWDLMCTISPGDCEMVDGMPVVSDPTHKNMMLEDVGLYGLNSLRTPEFAKLLIFRTKHNHSDPTEPLVKNGCHGTVHPDLIPDEPWIALIQRGDCYFSEKLANTVDTHGAKGFIVYNNNDQCNPEVIMNLTRTDLTTIMINNSVGMNIEFLELLLNMALHIDTDGTLPYSNEIFANITFNHCAKTQSKMETPLPVTQVTITFVVVMIIALAWLVVYYFQKHRNANRMMIMQVKQQKAAKKALKKIGERVIKERDEECLPDQQQDCTYCLDPLRLGETIRQLPCSHKFHKECVDEWLIHNRTCPNCHGNILTATGVTIRGIKSSPEDEAGTELTEMNIDSRSQLLAGSQAIAGHEDEESQGFGSQMIPGSQLLTDGRNMFLYVPNDVVVPTDSTIQIENPPLQLQMSQQQLMGDQQLLAASQNIQST